MPYCETPRVQKRKARLRKKILEETRRLVVIGGFGDVSMVRVAQAVGVATGTLYRYFPGKAELCTELFRVQAQIEVDTLEQIVEEEPEPELALTKAIRILAKRALRAPKMAWALLAEPVDPALERERLNYRSSYAAIFEQVIKRGIEKGVFHPLDPFVSAHAIVGALGEVLLNPLMEELKLHQCPQIQEHWVESTVQFCLFAVTTKQEASSC